jgi:hypothetical protein
MNRAFSFRGLDYVGSLTMAKDGERDTSSAERTDEVAVPDAWEHETVANLRSPMAVTVPIEGIAVINDDGPDAEITEFTQNAEPEDVTDDAIMSDEEIATSQASVSTVERAPASNDEHDPNGEEATHANRAIVRPTLASVSRFDAAGAEDAFGPTQSSFSQDKLTDPGLTEAWGVMRARTPATAEGKRGAEHLIWAYVSLENGRKEGALRSLCKAHACLGLDYATWPSGLEALADKILKRLSAGTTKR